MSVLPARRRVAPRRHHTRAAAVLIAALTLLLGGLMSIAPAANAVGTSGSISGLVSDSAAAPVANVDVTVLQYDADEDDYDYINDATTGADGTYTVGGLEAGTYRVVFESDMYVTQYWNNAASLDTAADIVVGTDAAVTSIDATLDSGASVSGKITEPGGVTEAGFHVHVISTDEDQDEVGFATTAADGTYTVYGLPAGTFTLDLHNESGTIPDQYLGGTFDFSQAQTFTLAADEHKTGVDAQVIHGASIAGVVHTPSGSGAGGVYVTAYKKTVTGGVTTWDYANSTVTLTSGVYSIDALTAGTYTLSFDSNNEFPYQYLGGVSAQDNATTVTVAAETTKSGVDHTLRTLGSLDAVPSRTTLTLTPSSHAFGKASFAAVAVTGSMGTATGQVQVRQGTKILVAKNLVGGKATLALPKTITVGKHNLNAFYVGAGKYVASDSAPKTLTITKAKSSVSGKLKKASITGSAKGKLTVTVKAIGVVPTGTVTIKDGSKVLRTAKLKNGKVTVTLPKLKKGKHKLTVKYAGSSSVSGSTSKKVTLTVKS